MHSQCDQHHQLVQTLTSPTASSSILSILYIKARSYMGPGISLLRCHWWANLKYAETVLLDEMHRLVVTTISICRRLGNSSWRMWRQGSRLEHLRKKGAGMTPASNTGPVCLQSSSQSLWLAVTNLPEQTFSVLLPNISFCVQRFCSSTGLPNYCASLRQKMPKK